MGEVIKGICLTGTLTLLARLGGRKTDGWLISMYGFSYIATSFLTWYSQSKFIEGLAKMSENMDKFSQGVNNLIEVINKVAGFIF